MYNYLVASKKKQGTSTPKTKPPRNLYSNLLRRRIQESSNPESNTAVSCEISDDLMETTTSETENSNSGSNTVTQEQVVY